jgi:hypothetical protein
LGFGYRRELENPALGKTQQNQKNSKSQQTAPNQSTPTNNFPKRCNPKRSNPKDGSSDKPISSQNSATLITAKYRNVNYPKISPRYLPQNTATLVTPKYRHVS